MARTLRDVFTSLMVKTASKIVTDNQEVKQSLEVTVPIRQVFELAGLKFSTAKPEPTSTIFIVEPSGLQPIKVSYYSASRAGARKPEPRLGPDFIGTWLKAGDEFVVGSDGKSIFAAKQVGRVLADEEAYGLELLILKKVAAERLTELAPAVVIAPTKRTLTRTEFVRSAAVVEIVLRRAAGDCEQPGCTSEPIEMTDGATYLEVHHLNWLRNGGADHPSNAAALCPRCHRLHHHARNRAQYTSDLRKVLLNNESTT